ncbi:MAG: hypothetical protein K0R13_778 [Propionibacteriaceae bacterium]|nr:hypothetical protein [Propionibacteriaceae bacterium]
MRSTRSSNDGARVPDPSILTPPAGRSRDLQGTTKLECRPTAIPGPDQHHHSWCRHHPRPIPGDPPSASGIPRRGRSRRIRLAKRDRRSMCTQRRGRGRADDCPPAGGRRAARHHPRHERPTSGRSRPCPPHRRPYHPRRGLSDRMGRRTRGGTARSDHRRPVPAGAGFGMGPRLFHPILDDRPPGKHTRPGPLTLPQQQAQAGMCRPDPAVVHGNEVQCSPQVA